MSSLHENEDSAHRSLPGEPATSVWLVKTPEGDDAVIVSFMDKDSEDPAGIYMYEPGADPVEINGVTMEGVATEFEFATVTVSLDLDDRDVHDGVPDEVNFPGDVMVTSAQRDADVANAVEAHGELVSTYETLYAQTRHLLAEVRDSHDLFHGGTFPLCGETMCRVARDISL